VGADQARVAQRSEVLDTPAAEMPVRWASSVVEAGVSSSVSSRVRERPSTAAMASVLPMGRGSHNDPTPHAG
jgi:hypothetical protein